MSDTELDRAGLLRLVAGLRQELRAVELALAPALGFAPYPPGSPGYSTDHLDYAVGAHTSATLAMDAAKRLLPRHDLRMHNGDWLRTRDGETVRLTIPQRGEEDIVLELLVDTAYHAFDGFGRSSVTTKDGDNYAERDDWMLQIIDSPYADRPDTRTREANLHA